MVEAMAVTPVLVPSGYVDPAASAADKPRGKALRAVIHETYVQKPALVQICDGAFLLALEIEGKKAPYKVVFGLDPARGDCKMKITQDQLTSDETRTKLLSRIILSFIGSSFPDKSNELIALVKGVEIEEDSITAVKYSLSSADGTDLGDAMPMRIEDFLDRYPAVPRDATRTTPADMGSAPYVRRAFSLAGFIDAEDVNSMPVQECADALEAILGGPISADQVPFWLDKLEMSIQNEARSPAMTKLENAHQQGVFSNASHAVRGNAVKSLVLGPADAPQQAAPAGGGSSGGAVGAAADTGKRKRSANADRASRRQTSRSHDLDQGQGQAARGRRCHGRG